MDTVLDESLARSNLGTAGSLQSGYGSGLNSEDLGKALERVLTKHAYRKIVKAQREQSQKDTEIVIQPRTLVNTW